MTSSLTVVIFAFDFPFDCEKRLTRLWVHVSTQRSVHTLDVIKPTSSSVLLCVEFFDESESYLFFPFVEFAFVTLYFRRVSFDGNVSLRKRKYEQYSLMFRIIWIRRFDVDLDIVV